MIEPIFVDTNVLVYSRDAAQPEKQRTASAWMESLWETRRGRLSVQVLQEFYVTTTVKLQPGLRPAAARREVEDLAAWDPVPVDSRLIRAAWLVQDRFRFSFWDSLIVAAARRSGCAWLLTEDLQDGQDLEGTVVVNPFLHAPSDLGLDRQ